MFFNTSIAVYNFDLGLAKREEFRRIPEGEKPTIIWWTPDTFPHSRKESSTHTIQCDAGPCITTVDRQRVNKSIPQAFMFYGTDFRANDLPLPRFPWQHWALFHEESPKNNWILSHEDCIGCELLHILYSADIAVIRHLKIF
jgi:hypothetical protein